MMGVNVVLFPINVHVFPTLEIFLKLHCCEILIPMMGIDVVLFPIKGHVFPTMEIFLKFNYIVVKS